MIIHIDDSELGDLIRRQAVAVGTVGRQVDRAVTVEALALKQQWVTEATGHGHLPHLPAAVTVDNIPFGKRVSFGDGGQGSLAGIATFGSATSGPVMNPFQHITPTVVRLERFIGQIGVVGLQ